MTLETNAAIIIGGAIIDAFGGSVVLAGIVIMIGLGIFFKQLSIGLGVGAVIAVFILGYLSQYADSRFLLDTPIGGKYPFFEILYIVVILGLAIYWAVFLRRR